MCGKRNGTRSAWASALLLLVCVSMLSAADVSGPDSIKIRALMPLADSFVVQPDTGSQNIDLVASKGQSIRVGTYMLTSNRTTTSYTLGVSPGDSTSKGFTFVPEGAVANSAKQSLEYQLTVLPTTERAVSINRASGSASKSLGILNSGETHGLVYEIGEIFADIPDFDSSSIETGWYVSDIKFKVSVN